MAWYKKWFGQEYLELYSHRDVGEAQRNAEFVARTLGDPKPNAVLDLACGAGRHTQALRKLGYRTLGMDLSLTLLTEPPPFPRVAGDIRRLPFANQSFDWVLNFFTSFGYFEEERENFQVLEEIRRVLTPGGRFLIDLFNRNKVINDLVPTDTLEVEGGEAEVERWFDSETDRVNKRIRIRKDGREQSFVESVRAYTEPEVRIGLRWAGLEVDDIFGDFTGAPFDPRSDRLILIGRKPGPRKAVS